MYYYEEEHGYTLRRRCITTSLRSWSDTVNPRERHRYLITVHWLLFTRTIFFTQYEIMPAKLEYREYFPMDNRSQGLVVHISKWTGAGN